MRKRFNCLPYIVIKASFVENEGAVLRQRTGHFIRLSAVFILAIATLGQTARCGQNVHAEESRSQQKAEGMEFRGKVVCLAEEMHRLYQTDLPSNHEHVYGFRTVDGNYYTLLRTKYSEALFVDKRLHEKELLLKGRVFPNTRLLDSTRMRSIRNGRVNDLYYYCSICSIKTIVPGPCMCCQAPVELTEKPISNSAEE